jgi:cupin 2 domain-containing protein
VTSKNSGEKLKTKNIFENVPAELKEELFETLAKNKNIRIERIISLGQTTPENKWYDQDENEFVLLLKGEAELLFESEEKQKLKSGDYLIIPAHLKHRVVYTSENPECIWLTVFYNNS